MGIYYGGDKSKNIQIQKIRKYFLYGICYGFYSNKY